MKYRLHHNLIHLRSKRGLTQLDMAKVIGKKNEAIYRHYESGFSTPTVHTLKILADFFKISIDELCYSTIK